MLDPICHHENINLFDWLKEFKEVNNSTFWYEPRLHPKLFYLWGHAYEFENNKWHIIEEFCKRASDIEGVWFATNIEIYEYTKSFESLEFSVDNKIVYNPSLIDVYFRLDKDDYVIKSGETLYL